MIYENNKKVIPVYQNGKPAELYIPTDNGYKRISGWTKNNYMINANSVINIKHTYNTRLDSVQMYGISTQFVNYGYNLIRMNGIQPVTSSGVTFTPVYQNGELYKIVANGKSTKPFYGAFIDVYSAGYPLPTGLVSGNKCNVVIESTNPNLCVYMIFMYPNKEATGSPIISQSSIIDIPSDTTTVYIRVVAKDTGCVFNNDEIKFMISSKPNVRLEQYVDNPVPNPNNPKYISNYMGSISINNKYIPLDTIRGIPVDSGGNYTDTGGQQWICDTIEWDGTYWNKVQRVEKFYVDTYEWHEWWNNSQSNPCYVIYAIRNKESITDGVMCDNLVNGTQLGQKEICHVYAPNGGFHVSIKKSRLSQSDYFNSAIQLMRNWEFYVALKDPIVTQLNKEVPVCTFGDTKIGSSLDSKIMIKQAE